MNEAMLMEMSERDLYKLSLNLANASAVGPLCHMHYHTFRSAMATDRNPYNNVNLEDRTLCLADGAANLFETAE